MSRPTEEVALVIGASRGIGKAIALAFAARGFAVGVVARRNGAPNFPGTVEETLAEIRATGGTAEGFACDIADSGDVNALVTQAHARFGRIDMLVNSAVQIVYANLLETTDEAWARAFDVNVAGAFYLTRAVAPVMVVQGGGRIVHLTGAGARQTELVSVATGASKAALERFVRGAAHELRAQNVAVNLFDPGAVKTERAVVLRGAGHDWTRHATPKQVAPAAVHLAMQPAEAMTGRIYSYLDHIGDVG